MNYVLNIIEYSQWPVLTAFLLGLAVAVHPCPLATNIAAMGYVARNVSDKKSIFINGLYYTFGRIIAYSILGAILVYAVKSGITATSVGQMLGEWGEKLLAPLLIIMGLYFIFAVRLHKEEHCPSISTRFNKHGGRIGSLLLGVILALSFCPESAIVFFGMLIPLSAKASAGYALPIVFAVATAIPTVILAWIVAYGVSKSERFKQNAVVAQRWINIIVGVMFLGAGLFCMFL